MSHVRILTKRVLGGNHPAQFDRSIRLWPRDDTSEPFRALRAQVVREILGLLADVALHTDPQSGIRMVHVEELGDFTGERDDETRMVITRIGAGNQHVVKAWRRREQVFEPCKLHRPHRFVFEIVVGRRPDPVVEIVLVTRLAQEAVHLATTHLHERIRFVPAEGDILDSVGAEQREIADVLLELLRRPRVPRVIQRTVAKLVTAERVLGRRYHIEIGRYPHTPLPPIH